MVHICTVLGGFRAFAKNVRRLLANGVGANGFNHRYDYKVSCIYNVMHCFVFSMSLFPTYFCPVCKRLICSVFSMFFCENSL